MIFSLNLKNSEIKINGNHNSFVQWKFIEDEAVTLEIDKSQGLVGVIIDKIHICDPILVEALKNEAILFPAVWLYDQGDNLTIL